MTDQPNVVLICVDQWRADCLSVAGHPVVHTPYLDGLALGGARFTKAYSATPTCVPARAALYTGLGQRSHGRVGYQDGVPWNYPTTIAGEFTLGSYQTQAVGKLHVYPERSQIGFQNVVLHDGYLHFARKRDRSYDLVDDYVPWLRQSAGGAADYFDHGVNCNSIVARPWDKPEHLHPTNWVVSQSIDFLRRRDPRKPFFLMMSFHRPHPPYDPPGWAFEQYLDAPMPDVPVGDWTDVLTPLAQRYKPDAHSADYPPEVLRRARAGYYGHMTHIDQQINRFVEVLQEYRLRDNTYFCFVSDHGEMMGDHRLYRKGYPYEGSAGVPFLLWGPNDCGIQPNSVCDQVVELRDVMPTLLECAGLPVPDTVEGRSVLPLARGESLQWRHHLHGEHTIFGQSLHWLTDGNEKYVWWSGSGHEQLFDLVSDPRETHDLARTLAATESIERWRRVLTEELTDREEGFVDGGRLVAGREVCPVLPHLARQTLGVGR